MTRRPAPYVVRDPKWDNSEFFADWDRLKALHAQAVGEDQERVAEALMAYEDYFERMSH